MMEERWRTLAAGGATVGLFLAVQLGALKMVGPLTRANATPVEDPSNPTNGVLYFLAILVASGATLLAFRFGVEWLIRGFVVLTSGLMTWFVLAVVLPPVTEGVHLPAAVGALAVPVALYVYPEWYVVDLSAVLMGAGAAGLFGISFGILPAVLLLVALAVYDAISVYRTEHMLTLAEGAMGLRVPVLFVIPTRLSYSYLAASGDADLDPSDSRDGDADSVDRSGDSGASGDGDREGSGTATDSGTANEADPPGGSDALFVGLGDAVMPTIVVASAATFVQAPGVVAYGMRFSLPSVGAMVGTIVGLVALLALVFRGRAHAGLPLLNGGAIAGYLVGATASGIPVVQALGLGPYL